jgi:polyisoprenoid-binding protein YceI
MMDHQIRSHPVSRRIRAVLATLALGIAATAAAAPARYEIDPEHLSVGFMVEHIGYARVLGLFRKASGTFTFDEETGVLGELRVVVDTASVFTNHRKRDDHLRSADFLNSAEFPEMVFTSAGATRSADGTFVIEGQLELLGTPQPMSIRATLNKAAEYPIGGGLFGGKPWVLGVSARGSFARAPHGMTYGVDNGWVGNTVELILEFEARRQ